MSDTTALELERDSLEGLEDTFHNMYEEADGKFRLRVKDIDDVAGLRKTVTKERDTRKELEKKLKAYEPLNGSNPEDLLSAVAERDELRSKLDELDREGKLKDAVPRAQHEKALADARKEVEAKLGESLDTIKTLRQRAARSEFEREAQTALAEAGGRPQILLPLIRENAQLIEDDGQLRHIFVDQDGKERYNSSGEPMGVADFVGELRRNEDFALAFDGTGASGGGTPPGGHAGGTGGDRTPRSKMSVLQKSQYIEKYGEDAYWRLPE